MADTKKETDGPAPGSSAAFDFTLIPEYNNDFVDDDDFDEQHNEDELQPAAVAEMAAVVEG